MSNNKILKISMVLLVLTFSLSLTSATETWGYGTADYSLEGNISIYENNTYNYINQTANLTGYWLSNGSSTATGNWNLGSNSLTLTGTIDSNNLTINTDNPILTLNSKVGTFSNKEELGGINFYTKDTSGGGEGILGGIRLLNDAGTTAPFGAIAIFTSGAARGNISESNTALYISRGRNIGFGTWSPISTNNGLDISSGGLSLIFGANSNSVSRTDGTTKLARIGTPHANSSFAPLALAYLTTSLTDNAINFGGGTPSMTTATVMRYYLATNVTTTTGTEKMRLTSNTLGLASGTKLGVGILASPLATLDVRSDSPTSFERHIKLGTGSTTAGSGSYIEFSTSTIDGYGARIGGQRVGAGGNDLVILTGGNTQQERVRVTNGGNVLIGTTTDTGSLLNVNGTIEGISLITNSISSKTLENITFFNSTGTGYANLNAKSFNVFSPEDRFYTGNKISLLTSPDRILNAQGKLAREFMFTNERKDNQPIEDKSKPIYVNKIVSNCQEVLISEGKIEDNETIEPVYQMVCTNKTILEVVGYETKLENATDIGAMAFNNRLLLTEVKKNILTIESELFQKDIIIYEQNQTINNLKTENTLIKLELCKKDLSYAWCKVVKE
jgi:hypothetical protein